MPLLPQITLILFILVIFKDVCIDVFDGILIHRLALSSARTLLVLEIQAVDALAFQVFILVLVIDPVVLL